MHLSQNTVDGVVFDRCNVRVCGFPMFLILFSLVSFYLRAIYFNFSQY